MLCNRCKKRRAIIYVSREVNGKPESEFLCFICARELNIPQIDEIVNRAGLDELESMSNQIMGMFGPEGFEPGGVGSFNPFFGGFPGKERASGSGGGGGEQFSPDGLGRPNFAGSAGKKNEKSKLRYLDTFGINLTSKAHAKKLDAIVGRKKEIYRVVQILSRRTKNNPCLIGEPGVGKTAIAEAIAQKIVDGDVPYRLSNKQLYLVDMTSLIAGTQFRGQFESRVKGLISEVKKVGNIILFIDEIHTLIGTGDSEGSMSAANILKPALSRGEIQLIGATTFSEYRKYIENDSALERRFQPVSVEESNFAETIQILNGIKSYYEKYHNVKIEPQIISDAVYFSERYINDRFLPDKAIDLIDEACAFRALHSNEINEYEKLLDKREKFLEKEKSLEPANGQEPDYEAIAKTKQEFSKINEDIQSFKEKVSKISVKPSDLARVVELWTGIPATRIEQSETKKLQNLEKELSKKVIGQQNAIKEVVLAVRRRRVQLSSQPRPVSFIFVGPTGVGKTELVKVLASSLFDRVDNLIRFDMSEFMEKHAVSRLTGSPPGYVGYDDAGQLTEKVRRQPYSVVLFDEIEKAHPDVMNLLLQILDEGKVADSHGRTVDFKNTIIVMTSNAGSSDGFGVVGFDKTQNEIELEKAKKALERFLRPEFMARVDEIVLFNRLTSENLRQIASLMLNDLADELKNRGINFSYDSKLVDFLIGSIEIQKYGARDLRREIRKKVEDFIVNLIIDSNDSIKDISFSVKENEVVCLESSNKF